MKNIILSIVLVFGFLGVKAQETNYVPSPSHWQDFFIQNMDYQVRAYFGIGGSTPLGIPKEIKHIKSYDPGLQLGLEVNATKWISGRWGLRMGVGVEGRGMKTRAETENYLTQIIQEDEKLTGYFTGRVRTKVKNTYVHIPISVVYQLSPRWNLYGGLDMSFAVDKEFDGYVSEGVFRVGTLDGQKIVFKNGGRGDYDFSNQLRTFQWGAHIGAEWELSQHFMLFPQLSYNFNGLLHDNFEAISFHLHSVYLDLGFAYKF